MIEKGYPITWLFLFLIIAGYVLTYTLNLHKENDRLFEIATQQEVLLKKQSEEIRQMDRLIETMFMYMETRDQIVPGLSPLTPGKRNDPI